MAKTDATVEEIKSKTDALSQVAMKLGEAMYKQQQQAQAGAQPEQPQTSTDANGEKVVDAEFEDKK